jgi:hypothetical protein
MTFGIMTLGIECCDFLHILLSVVMLSVVMLSVLAPN